MKPTKGLKFLLPHLSDADVNVIERYVADLVDNAYKKHTMNTDFTTDYQNAFLNGTQAMKSSILATLKQEAEGL